MPSVFIRCMLFVSSYFPLTVIFCILLFDKRPVGAIAILLLGITGLVALTLYFLVFAPRKPTFHEEVASLEKRDGDVLSYVASYLIPFVTFPLEGVPQVLALLVFIFVLLVVYINSNMIYINPMLNLAGYHLYEIKLKNNELSYHLITRHQVMRREMIRFVKIGDGVFLETRA
jgi:hypothetical protein